MKSGLAAIGLSMLIAAQAEAGERLLVPQLAGWTQIEEENGAGIQSSSFVPQGETSQDWHMRLTVQAYPGTGLTALGFLDQVVERIDESCEGSSAGPIATAPLTGHEAGRRVIRCGRYLGDGMGLVTLYYAIRGRQALYVVARSWRGEPFKVGQDQPVSEAEIGRWGRSLDPIKLCDDGRCP
jgi:hypothetical protein